MDTNQKQINKNKAGDKTKDNRAEQLSASLNNKQSTTLTKTNNVKQQQFSQTTKNNTLPTSSSLTDIVPKQSATASQPPSPSSKSFSTKPTISPPMINEMIPSKTTKTTLTPPANKSSSKNNPRDSSHANIQKINEPNNYVARAIATKSTDNTNITTTQSTNGRHQEKQLNTNNNLPSSSSSKKPPASLNSSTYSSAGSSSSSSSTSLANSASSNSSTSSASSTTSTSSSTSSSIFCSANQSHSSSAASSPGQNGHNEEIMTGVATLEQPYGISKTSHSKSVSKSNNDCGADGNIEKKNPHAHHSQPDYSKYEVAKMEDLGKRAMIFEHRLLETAVAVADHYNANSQSTSKITDPSITSSSSTTVQKNLSPNMAAFNKKLTNNSTTIYTNKNTLSDRIKILTLTNDNNIKHLDLEDSQKGQSTHQAQDYSPSTDVNSLTPTSTNAVLTSPGLTPASSWKTIAKRDKRKKKPAEKKIFAKEIPGNIGDRTVEELEIFIQSGTNGGPSNKNATMNININNIDHKNSKNKPQQSNNRVQQQPPIKKSQSMSSKLSNQPQVQQSNHSGNTSQNHNQDLNHTTKLPQIPNHQSSFSTQQQSFANTKSSVASKRMQSTTSQNSQPKTIQLDMPQNERSSKHQNPSLASSQQVKTSMTTIQSDGVTPQQAVVFAHHIKVVEEAEQQYTFGFFDDRAEQKVSKNPKLANQNSQINNINNSPRKKANNNPHIENKLRQKQSQTSLSSERSYKFKDRVNVNSFNYDQILKFISNSWETSQSVKAPLKSGRIQ